MSSIHLRKFTLLMVLLPFYLLGQSNEGTNFWFGFMEHLDKGKNNMVAMVTSKVNTSGTISIPERNWSKDFTITANEVTILELPSYAETVGSELVTNNAIQLTTVHPSSLYIHQYFGFRSEATIVLPVSTLGNEYYAMTYQGVINRETHYPSEFLIVATQDDTEVIITVSSNTAKGKNPNTTFSINLDAGETYQVQSELAQHDLTGSFIRSEKKIAVFSGNIWTEVPTGCTARDNLLEQMYPLSTWGKKFVTVPNKEMAYGIYRVLAAENNTNVTVSKGSPPSSISMNTYTLDAGEFVEFNLSGSSYIEANKGILVAQFLVGQNCNNHTYGDPSMMLLNSIEQTRDTVTLFNSSFQAIRENYINLIAYTVDIPTITFDGGLLTDLTSEIFTAGLDGEYSYVQLTVSAGAHTITSDGCGVIASAYGYGDVESYAYSGGASFSPINSDPIPDGGCLNDTVSFNPGLSERRFSFLWDLGDGTTTTEAKFEHFYADLGTYPVELILTDNCLNTIDTLNKDLRITLRQAVETLPDFEICEDEAIMLGATDVAEATYTWRGPNNFYSEEQFPVIEFGKPIQTGEYAAVGTVSGCSTFPAITLVEVHPTPQPELGPDTIICTEYSDEVTFLEPGQFTSYRWQDGTNGETFEVMQEGSFKVDVIDEFGCEGSDEVSLREQCPTELYVPNAFSPNYDGNNDTFGAYGHDIISLHMNIYDRWGALLFESNSIDEQWDGKVKGKEADIGVYVWIIEVEGFREDGSVYIEFLSGTVLLMNKRS